MDKRRPLEYELQKSEKKSKITGKAIAASRGRGGLQNRVTNILDKHSYYKAELVRHWVQTQEIKYTAVDTAKPAVSKLLL